MESVAIVKEDDKWLETLMSEEVRGRKGIGSHQSARMLKDEWLNPPYGLEAAKWLNKLADHGNGIALIFARTETKMFFDQVWNKADALLFIEGRLYFHHVTGEVAKANAGAPSVLIAYGKENAEGLKTCGIKGKYISLKN